MSDFIRVAALDEIPTNGSKLVEVDDVRVALFNLDGELYAIEDVCTHDGGRWSKARSWPVARSSAPAMAPASTFAQAPP